MEKTNMLKTPKEIKRDILGKFRSQLDDFDKLDNLETIPSNLMFKNYWQLLTSQEKSNFNKAVSDLIDKGLIDKVKSNIPFLRLTEKGADLIY
jgi:hypothetical protein